MSSAQDGGQHRRAGKPLLRARAVVATAVLVAVGAIAGCSIGLAESLNAAGEDELDAGAALYHGDASAGSRVDGRGTVAPIPVMDGAAASPDAGLQSPNELCGIPTLADDAGSTVTCDPDDGACSPPDADGPSDAGAPVSEAGYPLADGGVGMAMQGRSACHVVTVHGDAGVTKAPTCSAAGTGTSESACMGSSDCAPGFDCVIDDQRAVADGAPVQGVCRQYCCKQVCPTDQSYYCHMQATIGGSVAVPVCVPSVTTPASDGGAADGGPACQLLDDSTCAQGLTCQVVTQSGQLACVQPGTATAGESCATLTCAAGLSCIAGVAPYQTCAQLCNQTSDDCPGGQMCMSNATLANISQQIGVCSQ